MRVASVALAAFLLGGCALLSTPTPPDTYTLTAPSFTKSSRAPRGLLVIAQPTAISAIDSERIVARPATGEITYVQESQWSDGLTRLLQARILESFENASRLSAVGRVGDRLSSDFQLATDVRSFEVDAGSGMAVVEISAKIINERNGRIAAGKIFRGTAPVGAINGAEASRALDTALHQVLRDLVEWTTSRI
ncbi:ABC-type transport auxiliary lipoprotein family protein [Agaricicola taiwanensis]|uniref:ABC-type transport auxiliary lipoprotein family protein n=1 Tax=Agaricicola taiwanensis TaxID=591372 RepID=UPI00166E620A|nr:ABC-type transport auxiliary lipoprotein family protein [Agaricicola taiwanensis]